jgi:type VII secretion protein EccB
MPSTPTTKSQVQAHQFVLRRMQSALVRRDAVMLNDPMRTHSRATIVGVVLGAIGMIGFLVFGLISPQPSVPEAGNIVIGEQSGTVYVVAGNPKKLIPTFNMASARLLLMSQQNHATAPQGGAAAPADNASAPASAPKDATVVSDEQLANIPRGKLTGIPDGPQLLPTDKQRISNNWAVCDEIKLNPALPDPTSIDKRETTVLAGVPDLKREMGVGEALLATNDNGRTYLIYRLTSSPNQPNANAVRAEVDLSSKAVSTALHLNAKPRKISNELLNAIPEVARLSPPRIDGAGVASTNLPGLKVGDVFFTSPAGGGRETWVITKTGIQPISPAVADIIRTTTSGSQVNLPELGLDRIQNVKSLERGDAGYLPVDDYPQQIPIVLDPAKQFPVACLGWNIIGTGDNREPHTAVFVGSEVPGVQDQAITVGTPSPDGSKIDKFFMQPGFAAVVQSATVKETFGKGNIQLISDRGLRYGVPDVKTAMGLGLDNPQPAPDSIIKLLPTGASLNTQEVLKTFDSVPIDPNAGSFPTTQVQAAPK